MYTFILIIKKYNRENPFLDDMKSIYSGNICLISKNAKKGCLYIHNTGEIISGKFLDNVGSVKYPILIAENEVQIKFTNFPYKPKIKTNQIQKQEVITIKF